MHPKTPIRRLTTLLLAISGLPVSSTWGAPPSSTSLPKLVLQATDDRDDRQAGLLTGEQFDAIEQSMNRALAQLDRSQRSDGSYPAVARAQPAITGLCTMAFMSRGHLPGRGPYGDRLLRAVDYVMACQQPNGLLAQIEPEFEYAFKGASHTAPYNHSIAGLMLAEVYGMVDATREDRVRAALTRALEYSVATQIPRSQSQLEAGGWGYTPPKEDDHLTDLSVVSWQIMFLRAAKNAGFTVPLQTIDNAMAYVERRHDAKSGGFEYTSTQPGARVSMTGVGIVMFALGGRHDADQLKTAGEWLNQNPWKYDPAVDGDSTEYDAYYVSQAALQLGQPYWSRIYPPILTKVLSIQRPNGSWPPSPHARMFGENYTTAMYVLTLGAPLQLLPIYQR